MKVPDALLYADLCSSLRQSSCSINVNSAEFRQWIGGCVPHDMNSRRKHGVIDNLMDQPYSGL